jgi:large subunit ribosomal protein L24
MKIRKGDEVIVLAGKFRGERAKVEEALPGANKVVLDSLNTVKRHQKQVGNVMQAGIIDKFAPMHVSNVALWCGKHHGPAKVGYQTEGDTKVRVCRKCGETL